VVQVIEHLPSKLEVLSSNPTVTKIKMCSFPIDTITNNHELSSTNNINALSYRSKGQKLHWAKSQVSTGLCSL
jgi:hypothetical protein